jgi:hypothetical protein
MVAITKNTSTMPWTTANGGSLGGTLGLLAIACIALYGMKLSGAWRWIYAVTAMISLYLNVFVLVIQSFLKVGPLHALERENADHVRLPPASCFRSRSCCRTLTTVHVVIGLIGIVSGIVVMFGLLGSNRMPGLTAIFLLFT